MAFRLSLGAIGGTLAGFSLIFGVVIDFSSAPSRAAVSLDQARQLTGALETSGFAAPPRTIADITALLDQQKPDPATIAANRAKADAGPPGNPTGMGLARFYMDRGQAAGDLGREAQRLADYRKAVDLIEPVKADNLSDYAKATTLLAQALQRAGQPRAALALREAKVAYYESLMVAQAGKGRRDHRGTLFGEYLGEIQLYAGVGRLDAAQGALAKIDALLAQSAGWKNVDNDRPLFHSRVDWAHGVYLSASGKYAEAEPYLRRAVAENALALAMAQSANDPTLTANSGAIESVQPVILLSLARVLARQGRLAESEAAARQALLLVLKKRGRYATETAGALAALGAILTEEGRPKEAESLQRIAIDIYQKIGQAADSTTYNGARSDLGATLVVERRYPDAMVEFDAIRHDLANEPDQRVELVEGNVAYISAAIRTQRIADAVDAAARDVALRTKALGDKHYKTAEARGFYGAALAAKGDRPGALREFQAALPILLGASRGSEDENGSAEGPRRRLRFIIESYLRLLTDGATPPGGSQDAAEAFRIADAARGAATQQALVASAARAGVHDPALSDLVRREQDAERQIGALNAVVAGALQVPEDQQDQGSLGNLRRQIDALRAARATIRSDIEAHFPDYVSLIDPRPITLAQARAALAPGQALIATYVAEDRTYVWALKSDGAIAFAVAPIGSADMDRRVAALRRALDTDATTLEEIPAFDLVGAYDLYARLLQPVAAGWKGASDLLVVAHRGLAELPFGLLVTAPSALPSDAADGVPFLGYRKIPWLIRQASISVLPSVASLTALATIAAAPEAPRAFIGFGDPWFSTAQATAAKAEAVQANAGQGTGTASDAVLALRGGKVKFRAVPPSDGASRADLAELPRLPETAEELRAAALALRADPQTDIYLGARASEGNVRSLKLDDRRVVMFATHGLVPGDLAGLAEPALALSAPELAGGGGDGLLTMTKILGLRLNADWVVLSACNTAAGNGTGAEAVSGLGLAFIYAGTRSVLVSNWPVETNSARALTTKTFAALTQTPGMTRAQALRAAMLALIDGPPLSDSAGQPMFSYAHPIFWAPFSLVGDGGAAKQ